MKVEVNDHDDPAEIVEEGIGLIARGLFRLEQQQGVEAAMHEAEAILNHVRSHWFDLLKKNGNHPTKSEPA